MADQLRPVDLDFLEAAPIRAVSSVRIDAPPEAVFAAIADDPAGWGAWFPGFSGDGRYLGDPPYGVGSQREVRAAGSTIVDTVLAWDPPTRWAFTASGGKLRLVRALAEDYRVTADGTGSRLTWTLAMDLPGPARLNGPVLQIISGAILRRVGRGLERHLRATGRLS